MTTATPIPTDAHRVEDRDLLRKLYSAALASAHRGVDGAAEKALTFAGRLNAGVVVSHDLRSLAKAVELSKFVGDTKARRAEAHALAAASREVSDADNALHAAQERVEKAKAAHRAAAQAVRIAAASGDQLRRLMESKAVAAAFAQLAK